MGRIYDSEVHPWVRVARGWHYLFEGETRPAPFLSEFQKYCWPNSEKPGGPVIGNPPELTSELFQYLDTLNVDAALVMPGPHVCDNRQIADLVAKAPDRLKGLANFGGALPPFVSDEHRKTAFDHLEYGLSDLKLAGIGELWVGEWLPAERHVAVQDLHTIFSISHAHGDVPILMHGARNPAADFNGGAGSGPEWDTGEPTLFEDCVRQYPAVPFILGHMGKKDRELFDLYLAFCTKYDNVFLNTAFTITEFVAEAVRKLGSQRIVFGSDWYPFAEEDRDKDIVLHRRQMDIVENAKLSDQEKENIFWNNMESIFGAPGAAK